MKIQHVTTLLFAIAAAGTVSAQSSHRLPAASADDLVASRLIAAPDPGINSERTPVHFAHFTRRSEEHTSELQSLMRISYAVFCLKKKRQTRTNMYRNRHNNQTRQKTQEKNYGTAKQ